MTSIRENYNTSGYYYNSQEENNMPSKRYYYQPRSAESAEMGWLLASAASGLIYKLLPSFSNPFLKQMPKEHVRNHLYKDVFQKAFDSSGLKEKGLKLIHTSNPATEVGRGFNAFFNSQNKQIVLNMEKASISGFHELGHAMNNMKGGIGKFLQKLRGPGYYIAGLMASVALLSRKKPEGEKRNAFDFVQDNCGKIAFAAMLPTVIEESMASYKGVQAARKAGLAEPIIKNLKKFYGKALLSYAGYAALAGFATYVASKIMDKFTRPKKVYY